MNAPIQRALWRFTLLVCVGIVAIGVLAAPKQSHGFQRLTRHQGRGLIPETRDLVFFRDGRFYSAPDGHLDETEDEGTSISLFDLHRGSVWNSLRNVTLDEKARAFKVEYHRLSFDPDSGLPSGVWKTIRQISVPLLRYSDWDGKDAFISYDDFTRGG